MNKTHTKLKIFIVFIACILSIGWLEPASEKNKEGITLYNEEKFDEAISKFTDAQSFAPESNQLKFNIANTHYKKGKFPEAENSYKTAMKSDDVLLKAKGHYNMGNTMYRQGKLKESLDFYKESIKLAEENGDMKGDELDILKEDAKYNHEFVQKKIEEMQKEQKERQEQEEQDKKNQEEQQDQQKDQKKQEEDKKDKKETEQKEKEQDKKEPEQDQQENQETNNKEQEKEQEQEPSRENNTEKPPPRPQEKKNMTKEEAERILEAMKQAEKNARDLQEKEDSSPTYGVVKDW